MQEDHDTKPAAPPLIDRIGLLPPREGPDPFAHRRGEPRTFAAIWIVFVILALLLTLAPGGLRAVLVPEVYRAGLTRLAQSLACGVLVLWPMLRLSQATPQRPLRAFIIDTLIVLTPSVGVILPHALPWMRAWPLDVVLCVSAWLAAWCLLTGGLLACAFARGEPGPLPRTLLTLLLVLLCGLPLLAPQTPSEAALRVDPRLLASPVAGIADIARDRSWLGVVGKTDVLHWRWTLGVACAGACAWGLALLRAGRAGRV